MHGVTLELEGVDSVGPMDTFHGIMGPFGLMIQSEAPYGFRLDFKYSDVGKIVDVAMFEMPITMAKIHF